MEELEPTNGDVILCVSISNLLGERASLYEATRKYWKHKLDFVQQATHVIGVYKGEAKIVFDDMVWKYTDNPEWEGRVEFQSNEPNGVASSYLGKHVQMYFATRLLKPKTD